MGYYVRQTIRIVIIVTAILAAWAVAAHAQTPASQEAPKFEPYTYVWLEAQKALEKEGEHIVTLSFSHQRNRWLGFYVESARSNYWGESVIGPAFAPNDSLQIVIAGGIEHYDPRKLRGRFGVYYDHERTDSFAYADAGVGKSGNWYSLDAVRMFTSRLGVGLLVQTPGLGVGPKIELRFGDHVGLWVAPAYDWENKSSRIAIGGRLMFER